MITASESEQPQFYEPEEVQQILQLALARKGDQGELSRDQLREIASELEIDSACLEAAEQDWLQQKQINRKKQEFNGYRREQLKYSLVRYLIVNIFLLIINYLSAGTISWSLYILLFWGLGISLKTWKVWQQKGQNYEREFERWYLRQEMKQSLLNFWFWMKKTWQIITSG